MRRLHGAANPSEQCAELGFAIAAGYGASMDFASDRHRLRKFFFSGRSRGFYQQHGSRPHRAGTVFYHDLLPGTYRFRVQPYGTPTHLVDTGQLGPGVTAFLQVQAVTNWEQGSTAGGAVLQYEPKFLLYDDASS